MFFQVLGVLLLQVHQPQPPMVIVVQAVSLILQDDKDESVHRQLNHNWMRNNDSNEFQQYQQPEDDVMECLDLKTCNDISNVIEKEHSHAAAAAAAIGRIGGDDTTRKTKQQSTQRSKDSNIQNKDYRDKCQFYLAESSISNAGFGIYTVDHIPSKSPLTRDADAPSIVVIDSERHNAGKDTILWNHADYFWDGSGSGEFEADSVEESVVTFGALCNYHTFLKNVKPFSSEYNDAITSRNTGSPGMGAYSYYAGYLFYSTRDIGAAEEIFCDYGEEWLDGRSFGKEVVREEEYLTAANIILETQNGLQEQIQQQYHSHHQQQQHLDRVLVSIQNVVKYFDRRISKLLPDRLDTLQGLLMNASDAQAVATRLALNTVKNRTVEWIQSNGQCLDNLVPQISTLPHAGRGAFAQRFIAKGQVIVPAPLLQIMDYESLNMYDIVGLDSEDGRDPVLTNPYTMDEKQRRNQRQQRQQQQQAAEAAKMDHKRDPIGEQLIMNYCLSHPETSIYFCPQTNAILLNHCSTRKSYGGDCERYNHHSDIHQRGPNAELRWATDWDPDTKEWLNLTIHEMRKKVENGQRGLSLDVVATRDIHPGEEVFLDYGQEWEEDWEEHLETFVPQTTYYRSTSGHYVPIKELNDDIENNIRTVEELQHHPYPENAQLACIYWPGEEEVVDQVDSAVSGDDDSGRESQWQTDGSLYHDKHPDYDMYGLWWKCHVVEKRTMENGSANYTVEIYSTDGMTVWAVNKKKRILTNYPLKSMHFVPSKYASDQHLIGAFRSYIRIPDEIFPKQWKDMSS